MLVTHLFSLPLGRRFVALLHPAYELSPPSALGLSAPQTLQNPQSPPLWTQVESHNLLNGDATPFHLPTRALNSCSFLKEEFLGLLGDQGCS